MIKIFSTRIKRAILLFFGILALVLGFIGVFVPLLPTTPFLLIASYCFVRSSNRFNSWLLNNRVLGPFIKDYVNKRAIKKKIKWITIIVLWTTILISIVLIKSFLWVKILLIVIAAGVTIHIVSLRNSNGEQKY
ncbi:MAG: YbaN family protein [Tenuifilaceae bacterium]